MWFNLAASRRTGEDRETSVSVRDLIAEELTPDDLSKAQRLAREWDAAHPRGPRDPVLVELEKIHDALGGVEHLEVPARRLTVHGMQSMQ